MQLVLPHTHWQNYFSLILQTQRLNSNRYSTLKTLDGHIRKTTDSSHSLHFTPPEAGGCRTSTPSPAALGDDRLPDRSCHFKPRHSPEDCPPRLKGVVDWVAAPKVAAVVAAAAGAVPKVNPVGAACGAAVPMLKLAVPA